MKKILFILGLVFSMNTFADITNFKPEEIVEFKPGAFACVTKEAL